jgi:hypothetical protein
MRLEQLVPLLALLAPGQNSLGKVYTTVNIAFFSSVSDPHCFLEDTDPGKNLNADPDQIAY